MHGFSRRYDDALILAARAHRPQSRKGSDTPYIVHPVHVSAILLRYGFAEHVVVAGLLHDVVEDQDVTLDEIEGRFGAHVAELVAAVTEQKWDEAGRPRPWEDRKQEALAHLREASHEILALKAADVIHNTRGLARDVRRRGPSIWAYYNRGADESLWYYRSLATIFRDRMGAQPMADELEESVQDLETAVAESRLPGNGTGTLHPVEETRNG